MITQKDFKATSILFMLFFIFIIAGNLMLASTFNFPDILRESAVDRFSLFRQNEGAIVPWYYVMGLTSIIQIFMAVAMFHLTRSGVYIMKNDFIENFMRLTKGRVNTREES
jgi:hypothetical protein